MMRRLSILLFVLLATSAPSAWAGTRYVAQSSRGSGSGADSSNAMGISTFNSGAIPGDVALLMGNFTTAPNPLNSGTASLPIVYRSVSGNPNDVCLLNGLAITGSACDSNVVWRDLTIRGGVQLGLNHETARWGLRNVRILDGGLSMYFVRDARLDSVRCTRTLPASGLLQIRAYSDSATACRRDTVRNSSFALLAADGTGSTAINIFAGYDNLYEAVRCTVVTTANAGTALRFARVLGTVRGAMRDCYFYGVNNQAGGGGDEPMTFSFKDGVKLFKMYRDTIIVRGNANGSAPFILFAQNETDGNPANVGEEIGGNSWRNCYIRNETDAQWPIAWVYGGFDGDSLVGNTFIAKGNSIQSYYSRGDAVMATNSVVDHNLFVSFARAPAFAMLNGTAQQAVKFTNNLFYNPTLTGADSSIAVVSFGNAADWVSSGVGPVGSDNNIAWAPRLSTKRLVKWSGGLSAFGMNPWLGARSPATLDAGSRTGPLLFADSSLAYFDAHPLSGSSALTGALGYAGPFESGGSLDITPPASILDLSASNIGPTGATLTWTAPGNDLYSGTAASYDVRVSTVPITELNFAASASLANPPAPAPAGTLQAMTLSGLTGGTTYYYAMKTRDPDYNWSGLSNVAVVSTLLASDTTAPAAVTDLHPNP